MSKNTTFDAIAYLPDSTMAVSHSLNNASINLAVDTTEAAGKYGFCGGCSSVIAEIIGGIQEVQSDAISKSANQFAGNTVDIGIGT